MRPGPPRSALARWWRAPLALAGALLLANCGGDASTDERRRPDLRPPWARLPAASDEFLVVSGGAACGSPGCSADNASGTGVGAGAGDGSGASAGAGVGESSVRNATITAYKPDGTVLGSAALEGNLVSLYARTYRGPFILALSDAGNGEYWDEATRRWTPLQGQTLRAMVPSLSHHVSLNPLSEAAYRLAIERHGRESALTASAMRDANDTVLAQFNAKLPTAYQTSDVTNYATSIDDTSGAGTLPNTWAGRYSAVLAGMPIAGARFNETLSAPALDYGRQLTADIIDDGILNASASVASPAYGSNQSAFLGAGICTSVSTWGSAQLPSPLDRSTATNATPGQLTLLAGSLGGPGNCDGFGSTARFAAPTGVGVDASGNAYVADAWNHVIRRITPSGATTTYAGAPWMAAAADGFGPAARFDTPSGVAVDAAGNVYVADSGNFTIRKISADGHVSTIAGAPGVAGSADGTGAGARFGGGSSEGYDGGFARRGGAGNLAIDADGNLVVSDTYNHTIRRVSRAGVVTTIAGAPGQAGSADGVGASARFRFPEGVAADSAGNVYVADFGNSAIRRISRNGTVTTVAGVPGQEGYVDGVGAGARFHRPYGVAIDPLGNLVVTEHYAGTLRKVTPVGVVSGFAGHVSGSCLSDDGIGPQAGFCMPAGIASDSSGTFIVVDALADVVRRVSASASVTTLSGLALEIGAADGPGESARFFLPKAAASDAAGNVFVADTYNRTIRRISPSGVVGTIAGSPGLAGSADGFGSAARFDEPAGIAVDAAGNVYVSDQKDHTIRRLRTDGYVVTLAGVAGVEGAADGRASSASFSRPQGLAADAGGNVFVADTGNHTIRKILPNGDVTTFAGRAGQPGSTDGLGGEARFNAPSGVALDAAGNLYVADTGNSTVRRISPSGRVTTLAGVPGELGVADGPIAVARFAAPAAIACDASGNVYVTEQGTSRVRRVGIDGRVNSIVGTVLGAGNQLGPLPGSLAFAQALALRSQQLVIVATSAILLATPNDGGW